MKKILIASLILFSSVCRGQAKIRDSKIKPVPCSIDTIKGVIYFQGTQSTSGTITEGYFISPCGGIQIGNFYGYDKVPTFIPAYFIRNDQIIFGKRRSDVYIRQRNEGYFTDTNFKVIPIDAVYGLLVIKGK